MKAPHPHEQLCEGLGVHSIDYGIARRHRGRVGHVSRMGFERLPWPQDVVLVESRVAKGQPRCYARRAARDGVL